MKMRKRFQLHREESLKVRRRRRRQLATGTWVPMARPDRSNQRWWPDSTCEALALVVDTSIGGHRMERAPDVPVARRGSTATIVSDNGTEMASQANHIWSGWPYIAQGKPQHIGLVDSFNGKQRDERLNAEALTAFLEV